MESAPPVVRSDKLYKTYWLYWRLLGVEGEYLLRWLLDIVISFFITFWNPVHLIIGLFNKSTAELFRSLHFTTECFFCSLKFVCFRWKLAEIKAIERLLKELDQRAESDEDRQFFDRNTKHILSISYLVAAVSAIITGTASGLFSSERKLMYVGWFPYDVQGSSLIFWISFCYQAIAASVAILENLANDSYPPMTFCILSGHVRLLSKRLSRIGYDEKVTMAMNTKELIENIKDHSKIMEIIRLLKSTLYLSQLGQFISSGINISITLINILFFAENTFAIIYYFVFFAAMLIELFPSCYFGTLLSMEFDNITYAIFSSNWPRSNRSHCRILIILMQLAVVKVNIKAGGMIGIGLDAFFATVRMSYSFFTLAMSLR
ncbi:odorant receptor 33a [Drosophila kikkawai]|uniref:Odorant receptor n=1 Tax=Drosophila kikkawai TaxID=30033 RepID=A0A6P4I773_DROKI|nr:odorant receptor 33a [Drosophila kikkawai]